MSQVDVIEMILQCMLISVTKYSTEVFERIMCCSFTQVVKTSKEALASSFVIF